ncbi:MAG: hypothetical protein M5U22_13225 [Thermoleophilia bacterium]|nr:hypothetical protein [Thermoleophilia bacterium]
MGTCVAVLAFAPYYFYLWPFAIPVALLLAGAMVAPFDGVGKPKRPRKERYRPPLVDR